MLKHLIALALGVGGLLGAAQTPAVKKPQPPQTMRLYVFDCGYMNFDPSGVVRYNITEAEAVDNRMAVPCYLIAHPRGTLMFNVGVSPDADVEKAAPKPATWDVLPYAHAVVSRTLKSQMAAIGYTPADITYVGFSHAHKDHTAILDAFTSSTWLIRPVEREFMVAPNNARVRPDFYTQLDRVKTIAVTADEYDVFGDGKVVMKLVPGHTPGHQVLILQLAQTGRLMLGGDVYHFRAERDLHRAPPDNEFNVAQATAARTMIEDYIKKTNTTFWLEHDFRFDATLKKSPQYYE